MSRPLILQDVSHGIIANFLNRSLLSIIYSKIDFSTKIQFRNYS